MRHLVTFIDIGTPIHFHSACSEILLLLLHCLPRKSPISAHRMLIINKCELLLLSHRLYFRSTFLLCKTLCPSTNAIFSSSSRSVTLIKVHAVLQILIPSAITALATCSSSERRNHVLPRSICLSSCFRGRIDTGFRNPFLLTASKGSLYHKHETRTQKVRVFHSQCRQQRLST